MPTNDTILSGKDERPGWSQLKLKGRITIDRARELHSRTLDLAATDNSIVVDCAELEYLDLSALQILCCLKHDREKAGKSCELRGVSELMTNALFLAGI